ncbi:hypothetical protein [Williamsia sp. DF01-3]|uniref:hypothetical protein n=1 Tax=Williamsia sp. DF01-3 TaxID=2934157 RepID=UPI001FF69070|nr:hypothetical protein [Williamsia sp. DF01-3]MCK0517651.1 hypothetical protein [Williamsia sp. DF01-3]
MTKGLAAVLADSPSLAVDLIEKTPLKDGALSVGVDLDELRTSTDLTVDSEERQVAGVGPRRDLVLRFLRDGARLLTVIIEAKHTDLKANDTVLDQLAGYVDVEGKLDMQDDRKVGLTLTKAQLVPVSAGIASITWTRLTEILSASKSTLAHQFAMHVRESMSLKHFEVEVYSVPAAGTATAIEEHFVHAFPQHYSAPICLFLAPRQGGGGAIPKLYRVLKVYDVSDAQLKEQIARIDEEDPAVGARMRGYFADRLNGTLVADEQLRVFVLEPKPIVLEHKPRPKRNNPFKTSRWSLADLLDSSSKILP